MESDNSCRSACGDPSKTVVITGFGPITAIGMGKEEYFNAWMDKVKGVQMVPKDMGEPDRVGQAVTTPYGMPDVDMFVLPFSLPRRTPLEMSL